jgi:hypothetical protein
MKQRGRKSSAALDIAPYASTVGAFERPDAPYDLTDEQTDVWRAVVAPMPADYFTRETHDMLAQYCRHVVSARRVAQLISQHEKSEDFDVTAYSELLKLQERESRAVAALARGLRISKQSTVRAEKVIRREVPKPWEQS